MTNLNKQWHIHRTSRRSAEILDAINDSVGVDDDTMSFLTYPRLSTSSVARSLQFWLEPLSSPAALDQSLLRVCMYIKITGMDEDKNPLRYAGERLQDIICRNRLSQAVGAFAVCSAHPSVIAAAAHAAVENGSVLHVESTASQVNQAGGYTGQTPAQFASFVHGAADHAGLQRHRVLLGGDHLGPFPWRGEASALAMDKAHALVRKCVLAGYQKMHLDTSMPCADDPKSGPDERTIAARAAALCETAENAFRELPPSSPPLLYVVGTEVPAPGGESNSEESITITAACHVQSSLEVFKRAFDQRGLAEAWEKVIGLVVQPGVEFGEAKVFDYDRSKAKALRCALPPSPQLVYEAHSTDYQLPRSLRQMVEDHFAILKVGPELTFAFREAVFALSAIECELLQGKAARVSNVRGALEAAMLRNPSHWRGYYHGDDAQLRISRFYGYSDRCRYYWPEAEVQAQIDLLIENLGSCSMPFSLISQYLPSQYDAIRAGGVRASPSEMIAYHIRTVLHKYAAACGESTGESSGRPDAD